MTTKTIEEVLPKLDDGSNDDDDGYAHYCRKEEIVRANVEGGGLKTLCGKRITGNRDPNRFPICPDCKRLMENVRATDRGAN